MWLSCDYRMTIQEAEIKKAAKRGDKQTAAVYAKQLVRLRQQKTKSVGLSAQITATGHQITVSSWRELWYLWNAFDLFSILPKQSMQAQSKMAQAMGSTAKVMAATNKQMKLEDIQSTLANFDKESTKMDLAGEMSA